jgi:predicted nucleic acid-binding protein
MKYLLDSDALSDLYDPEAPGHEAMTERLASLASSDQVFISILSLYEHEYGFANAPEEKKALIRKRISDVQSEFPILPLTPEAAGIFGSTKASLRELRQLSDKGVKGHNIDMMIAASAISEECVLVSLDSLYRDIQKIYPVLRLESWR